MTSFIKILMLPGEDKLPLAYMGLVDDYNGVEFKQASEIVSISAGKYIDRVFKTHAWDKLPKRLLSTR